MAEQLRTNFAESAFQPGAMMMTLAALLFSLASSSRSSNEQQSLIHAPPEAAEPPLWARSLARKLGPHVEAQRLLAEWQEDRARFPLNATRRVSRGDNAGLSLAAMATARNATTRNITVGLLQMQALHG